MLCSNIDFSVNGLSTEIAFDHNGPPTRYKMKVNTCKSIDLVIRIELTKNLTIYFRMFLYLVTCFLRVTAMWFCFYQIYLENIEHVLSPLREFNIYIYIYTLSRRAALAVRWSDIPVGACSRPGCCEILRFVGSVYTMQYVELKGYCP